ncbi:hypothetical protein [Streptomyces sp. NPDC090080]|uniref:hypothetical protein n=1 Tax=Streptomyces sp. NPDC090080 TaxID=3365939 RepID=UPI00380263A9
MARNMVFNHTEATSRARAIAGGLVDGALVDPPIRGRARLPDPAVLALPRRRGRWARMTGM